MKSRIGHIYDKFLGYAASVAIAVYLIWRVFYTLPFSYGYFAVGLGLVVLLFEALAGIEHIINHVTQVQDHHPERPDIPDSWYPEVDIFIATHDEDENIVYNTANACCYLSYPDSTKIHVHICDDGNRPAIRELAERLGVNYIGMPNPQFAKAGNINNGLAQTSAPYVAFLDADMIPRRDFLMHMIPYFFAPKLKKDEHGRWVEKAPEEVDPKDVIGYVQSPQGFYTPDLFQYNLYAEKRIPNEQIYFFREVNVARSYYNTSILCGSNVVMDRAALADIGNFATHTITEDFETGMRLQVAGYKTISLDVTLANGLTPPNIGTLISQRERWGRGCIQSLRNVRPIRDSRVSFMRKLLYLNTLIFWLTFLGRYVFVMAPIMVAFFHAHILETSMAEIAIFWLPSYLLHMIATKRISAKTRTLNWCNVIDTIQYPFLCVPILAELCGVSLRSFKVTEKGSRNRSNVDPALILPHVVMLVLSVISLFLFIGEVIHFRAFYAVIMIFWVVVNIKCLVLATFFMLGRVNDRNFYRFNVRLPVEFETAGIVCKGFTNDVSEGGLSADLDFPLFIGQDQMVTIRVNDATYRAEMQCTMVQVKRAGAKGWTYAMEIAEIDDKNRSQYRQILYERDPTLPDSIHETIPIVEDLKVNFDRRLTKPNEFFSRKLPRILNILPATLEDGTPVSLNDFSYRYMQIYPPVSLVRGQTATVEVEPGLNFLVTLPEEHLTRINGNLVAVVNWEQWVTDPRCRRVVARWAGAKEPLPVGESQVDVEPVEVEVEPVRKRKPTVIQRITRILKKTN
ncbi:MAG: glycosyltransferase [Planctomycetaceae bacterium]|nr:glycosyltransferase [Planctomycetaceae bacterium]